MDIIKAMRKFNCSWTEARKRLISMKNYILNGGFEEGSLHWSFIGSDIVSDEKKSGRYCAVVHSIGQTIEIAGGIINYFSFCYKPVDPNKPEFSVYTRPVTIRRQSNLNWEITRINAPNEGDTAEIIHDIDVGNGWREILVKMFVSTYTAASPSWVSFYEVPESDRYYIDDIYWGLTPSPPPPSPSPWQIILLLLSGIGLSSYIIYKKEKPRR